MKRLLAALRVLSRTPEFPIEPPRECTRLLRTVAENHGFLPSDDALKIADSETIKAACDRGYISPNRRRLGYEITPLGEAAMDRFALYSWSK